MCNDGTAAEKALAMVREAAGEVKKGRDYLATVVTVREFGAFVRIYQHVEGLVHASEWDEQEPPSMRSAATEGDKVMVRVRGADEKGRLILSRRDALTTDPADAAN